MMVTFGISLATLMYGALLPEHLDRAIGLALISSLSVGLMAVLLGSRAGVVAHVQDAPAAILAAAAAGMLAGFGATTGVLNGPDAGAAFGLVEASLPAFLTIAVTVALTALASGITLLLVGVFRLGRLVRFLPYPVVGGFMAGTGYLLFTGGLSVLAGRSMGPGFWESLLAPGSAARLLPGLAFAVLLLVLGRNVSHFLVWPMSVLGASGLFYAVVLASGRSLESWRAGGQLLGPFPEADLTQGLRPADLALVDWSVVLAQLPTVLTVAGLTLMAVLLNSTAIELLADAPVDLNRELRSAGLGNLLAGALGGQIGYQSVSMTALNGRASNSGRAPVIVALLFLAATILFGASLLEYVPTLLVGGLIAFLGLEFLYDWLVSAWRRLTAGEYAIVVVILIVIALAGFLPGVALGLVLTVGLFVVNYSRIDAVRLALDGCDLRSRVRRDPDEERIINASGEQLFVLQLQGFLFFGTTNGVVSRIRRRAQEGPLHTVILDFRRVTGLDASTTTALRGLLSTAARNGPPGAAEASGGYRLYLADLSATVFAALERRGLGADLRSRATIFDSLDEALEASEVAALERAARVTPPGASTADLEPAADQAATAALDPAAEGAAATEGQGLSGSRAITAALGTEVDSAELEPYLTCLELAEAERLIAQGEPPDAVYFVSSGRLSAWLRSEDGSRSRLESMRAGSVVGEVAFFTGEPRSATVTADEPTVVYQLTREALNRYEALRPRPALLLIESLSRLMAARIHHLTKAIDALER